MKSRTKKLLATLTLAAGVLTVTTYAWAKATRLYYMQHNTVVGLIDPGKSWVSDDGIEHIRGLMIVQELTTITEDGRVGGGTEVDTYNIDRNTETGDGHLQGTSMVELWGPDEMRGTWVAHTAGKYENFALDVKSVVAHGLSDNATNKKAFATGGTSSSGDGVDLIAYMLDPHGGD